MKKIVLLILLGFLVIPLVFLILWSISINYKWPNLMLFNISNKGYSYWFEYKNYVLLIKSILFSVMVSLLTIIIVFPLSKQLAYSKSKYKGVGIIVSLLPILVPFSTIMIGTYYQFIFLKLSGNILGVLIVHIVLGIPYSFIVMYKGFKDISPKIEFQGKLLKANTFQRIKYILVPMLLPSITTSFSIVFIVSLSQYFVTFIIGAGKIKTYAMEMFPYIINGNRNIGSVFSLIFIVSGIITTIIVTNVLNRYYRNRYGFLL